MINNISIEEISYFFSVNVLKKIMQFKITNLKEFLSFSDSPELNSLVGSALFNEIKGTSRILKCKYFGVDPSIDEFDEKEISISRDNCHFPNDYLYHPTSVGMEYVKLMLGFSTRGAKEVCRNYGTLADFFKSVRNGEASLFFKNLGKETQRELLAKMQVIIDYHDNINKVSSVVSEQDGVVLLTNIKKVQAELQELIARRNIINQKIAELQDLVVERDQINSQIESICLSIEERLFNKEDIKHNTK